MPLASPPSRCYGAGAQLVHHQQLSIAEACLLFKPAVLLM
jgi:hypothetical protein